MRVAILGNGGFGTALAIVGERAGHEIRQWGHDPLYTGSMARTRENPRYLPGVVIADSITITADAAEALAGAEVALVAVPAQHVRGVIAGVRRSLPRSVPVVSLAKGLEQGSGLRPSQVVSELCGPSHPVLALTGPSHAEELARGLPATVVLAGQDAETVRHLQDALSSPSLRIYRSRDMLGCELCGALKNVMAIAAGVADGLGFGDNAKAAVLSRGLVEMARYGVAEGAELQTFFGLAGMGDLAVTAWSRHGRNRAVGERIGRGETLSAILASTHTVAEGVWTARVVQARARTLGVEMPLCASVCAVLYEGVSPADAVTSLMTREYKEEIVGPR
jgi:glycerol-3-phosphate dehydrogenase (NAD(P)+)